MGAAAGLRALGGGGLLEPTLEALDAAARVDELLLARVERVAGRADLDVKLGLRRPRRELVPAGAGHVRDDVLGMNVRLHEPARIAEAISGPTLPPETTAATGTLSFPPSTAATAAAPAGSHA